MALLFTEMDWKLADDCKEKEWDIIKGLAYARGQAFCRIKST
jgi:hypothetical protein